MSSSESLPQLENFPSVPDYSINELSLPALIRSAITDEIAERFNKSVIDQRGWNTPEDEKKALIAALPEGAIAYETLLSGHLKHHAYKVSRIHSAEEFHDWVDTALTLSVVQKAVHGDLIRTDLPYPSRVIGGLTESIAADSAAVEDVIEDIKRLPETNRRQLIEPLRSLVGINSVLMMAFANAYLPDTQMQQLDEPTQARLKIVGEVEPLHEAKLENTIPLTLMQVVKGTANAQIILPAVEQYFSGSYPAELLTDTKRRPAYSRSITNLAMVTMHMLSRFDEGNESIYTYLVSESSKTVRGVYHSADSRTPEQVFPPLGAFIAIANKILTDSAKRHGTKAELLASAGGDTLLPQAVKIIMRYAAEPLRRFTVQANSQAADHGKDAIRAVELMSDRAMQFISAKSAANKQPETTKQKPVKASPDDGPPKSQGAGQTVLPKRGQGYYKRFKPGYGKIS